MNEAYVQGGNDTMNEAYVQGFIDKCASVWEGYGDTLKEHIASRPSKFQYAQSLDDDDLRNAAMQHISTYSDRLPKGKPVSQPGLLTSLMTLFKPDYYAAARNVSIRPSGPAMRKYRRYISSPKFISDIDNK